MITTQRWTIQKLSKNTLQAFDRRSRARVLTYPTRSKMTWQLQLPRLRSHNPLLQLEHSPRMFAFHLRTLLWLLKLSASFSGEHRLKTTTIQTILWFSRITWSLSKQHLAKPSPSVTALITRWTWLPPRRLHRKRVHSTIAKAQIRPRLSKIRSSWTSNAFCQLWTLKLSQSTQAQTSTTHLKITPAVARDNQVTHRTLERPRTTISCRARPKRITFR